VTRACILGCSGPRVTAEERAFFAEAKPWGFILFKRNVETAQQTRELCDALREVVDDEDALVFIDQEGGRVQRARPPLAANRAPAARFGDLYRIDPQAALEAVRLNHRLMAAELRALGVDADCAPCLDLLHPQTHAIIGDRAFGPEAGMVAALGRAAVDGLVDGGCAPVIKHMPGHGRATADSHLQLPVVETPLEVLEATDFEPFRALADTPMAMTAHVVFSEVDPDNAVTVSRHAIETVIRGAIGFDGLLMTDDLSMKALGGDLAERTRRSIDAGCDVVLHGAGAIVGDGLQVLMHELTAVAGASPRLAGKAAERAEAARESARTCRPFDAAAAEARLDSFGLAGRAFA
jgi:beta-N-acetylhexosaminidase